HSVLAPSGPARHCGVFCTPQWLQRRSPGAAAAAASWCGAGWCFGRRPRFLGLPPLLPCLGFLEAPRGASKRKRAAKNAGGESAGRKRNGANEAEEEQDDVV